MFGFIKKQKTCINADIDALKEALKYLEENPKVEFDPYPNYEERIYTVIDSLGVDEKYLSKSDRLKDKPYEEMTLDDLAVMYTFINRAERFSLGAISAYVEDGSLARMAKREIELLEK